MQIVLNIKGSNRKKWVFCVLKGPTWSLSYGSWIYNYLCNQCWSPLKLWILIPLMVRCTRYNIIW